MSDALYSSEILRLAADIPHIGRLARPDGAARRVSRLCGSEVGVEIALQSGVVSDIALQVKACALGQASAAILARHAIGAMPDEIVAARDGLAAMLKGADAPEGRFAELSVLDAARGYPARHASIRLAFEAAAEACNVAQGATTETTLTG